MKIEITAEPVYWLNFSVKQLQTLLIFSANHYDGVCKEASKTGGFILGWYNSALYHAQDKDSSWPYFCRATLRQVDTVCKILEIGDALPGLEEVNTVSKELHRAVFEAGKIVGAIKINL